MMKKLSLRASCIFLAGALFVLMPAYAEEATPSLDARNEAELNAASEAANKAAIDGPHDVHLAGQAVLHLPAGYFFIPQPEAGRFSRALGNPISQRLIGLAGARGGAAWLAYITYNDDGHVEDDDAKSWSADDMLSSLKEGTEAGNADRQSRGFPQIEVTRWIEPPTYDAVSHHLVWSALVKEKNNADAGSANYNTYALGRDGHFELDLVSDADKVEAFKANAKTLLAGLEFDPGHRYADYKPGTDRLAAYGLAALVGGVAAKKLGLIALVGAFLIKFAKLIGLAVFAGLAAVRRLFRRKASVQEPGPEQIS